MCVHVLKVFKAKHSSINLNYFTHISGWKITQNFGKLKLYCFMMLPYVNISVTFKPLSVKLQKK